MDTPDQEKEDWKERQMFMGLPKEIDHKYEKRRFLFVEGLFCFQAIDKMSVNIFGRKSSPARTMKVLKEPIDVDTPKKSFEEKVLERLKDLKPEENFCLKLYEALNITIEDKIHRCLAFNEYSVTIRKFYKNLGDYAIPEVKIRKYIMYQLAHAVDFLRTHYIVHGNITPDTVAFVEPPMTSFTKKNSLFWGTFETVKIVDLRIRLIDFELSVDEMDNDNTKNHWERTSPAFASPEMLLKMEFYFPTDVWSMACTMWFIFCKNQLISLPPSAPNSHYLAAIEKLIGPFTVYAKRIREEHFTKDGRIIVPEDSGLNRSKLYELRGHLISGTECYDQELMYDLVSRCLKQNSEARLTSSAVLNQPFFYDVSNKIPKASAPPRETIVQRTVSLLSPVAARICSSPWRK